MSALLVAAMAILCFFLCAPISSASAENYSFGNKDPLQALSVHYGDKASFAPFHPNGSTRWVKVVNYKGSTDDNPVPADLLDENERFVVKPGRYYISAFNNIKVCDQNGTESTSDSCTGTVILNVLPKTISICFDPKDLVKGFGETIAADTENNLPWSFVDPAEQDDGISLTFSSEGFAASASVKEYSIDESKTKIFLDHVEQTQYYSVSMSLKGSTDPVRFRVTPKALEFSFEKDLSLPFNDFLSEGNVDTLSRTLDNGDVVTVLLRLKETPQSGVLTVGESYEIEFYGYTVKSSGDPVFYEAGATSDYEVSVDLVKNMIKADKGSVVIYSDEDKCEERAGIPKYLYLSPSLPYLDDAIKGTQSYVPLVLEYYGAQLTVNCTVQGSVSGALPCGAYSLTVSGFSCEVLVNDESAVTFEGGTLPLTVTPRVLKYDGESTVEYGVGALYEHDVEVSFGEIPVTFTLRAEVGEAVVGSELSYLSASSENENFELSFDDAKLVVVKRTTGVTLVAEDRTESYGVIPQDLAVLWLDYGKTGARRLTATLSYSYKTSANGGSTLGIPSAVGIYFVTCEVVSDLYQAEPVTFKLTVVKRAVLAVFSLTKAEKPYRTTFTFSSVGNNVTVQLLKIYAYDKLKDEQGEEIKLLNGDFGGTILTSAGGAAEAAVGEYEFDYSNASSPKYVIEKAAVKVGTQEVKTFKVVKAPAPEAPLLEYTVENKEIVITTSDRVEAELSLSADFASTTTKKGTGKLSFPIREYGSVHYLRMRISDDANYLENGAWATATCIVPYLAPTMTVDASQTTSTSLTFTATMQMASVAATGYVLKYRVGDNGSWKEGNVVTGLSPATPYTIYFRYERGEVIGKETSISATTLRAPIEKEKITYTFDSETGELTLSVDSAATLEYMLCSLSGKELTEWVSAEDLPALEGESEYLLKVRIAASGSAKASDVSEIKVDTHKAKEPLTFKKILSDWFLLIVGGILLVATVILLVAFIRSKKKTDREELGGK